MQRPGCNLLLASSNTVEKWYMITDDGNKCERFVRHTLKIVSMRKFGKRKVARRKKFTLSCLSCKKYQKIA